MNMISETLYCIANGCMWKYIFINLLVFVHRVYEDRPTCLISKNALEHTLVEVLYP